AADPFLAIVVNIIIESLASAAQVDARAMIPADFTIGNRPVRSGVLISDGSELRGDRVLLDRQKLNHHIARRPRKSASGDTGFYLVARRVICEIDLLIGVIEEPRSRTDEGNVCHM